MKNELLQYGDLVFVIKGIHKGLVCIYDNDEENLLVLYPVNDKYEADFTKDYILTKRSNVIGLFIKVD